LFDKMHITMVDPNKKIQTLCRYTFIDFQL